MTKQEKGLQPTATTPQNNHAAKVRKENDTCNDSGEHSGNKSYIAIADAPADKAAVFAKLTNRVKIDAEEAVTAAYQEELQHATETLPTALFCPTVRNIIDDTCDALHGDRNVATLAVLVAGAVAAGKKVVVTDGNHPSPLNFAAVVVGDSTTNKSSIISHVFAPLKEYNSLIYNDYRERLREYKQAKDNSLDRPICCKIIANDMTTEMRTAILATTKYGHCTLSDEIRTFFDDAQRYSKNGDGSRFMTIIDTGNISYDRLSHDSLECSLANYSVIGTIQPEILRRCFGGDNMTNGFNQRWLIAYIPDDFVPDDDGRILSEQTANKWHDLLFRIIEGEQRTLRIEGDAYDAFLRFKNGNRHRIREEQIKGYRRAILGKLDIQVQRIAAVIHILNEEPGDNISVRTMNFAIAMMRYFEGTQNKVYEILTAGEAQKLPTKKEALRHLEALWKIKLNRSALADMLGVSQSAISQLLSQ